MVNPMPESPSSSGTAVVRKLLSVSSLNWLEYSLSSAGCTMMVSATEAALILASCCCWLCVTFSAGEFIPSWRFGE